MKIDRKWLAIGFLVAMGFSAYVYAATVGQILNAVYDSSNSALRVSPV